MTIFYIICCIICTTLILCNVYFAKNKLTGRQLLSAMVMSLFPVINTLFIIAVFCVAYKMAVADMEK